MANNLPPDTGFVSSSVRLYLNDIEQYPLLTTNEELELARSYGAGVQAEVAIADFNNDSQSGVTHEEYAELALVSRVAHEIGHVVISEGQAAKDTLIKSNLRLVVYIAKKYQGRGAQLQDLIQDGNEGLIGAIEKFNPEKGTRISTFANWGIRKAILTSIAEREKPIRVPVDLQGKINRHRKIRHSLENTHGLGLVTDEMVCQALGLGAEELDDLKRFEKLTQVKSINAPITRGSDTETADTLEDEGADKDFQDLEIKISFESVMEVAREILTDREFDIMVMRNGLAGDEPLTQEEVRKKIGVSRVRISHIEQSIYKKLRHPKHGLHS